MVTSIGLLVGSRGGLEKDRPKSSKVGINKNNVVVFLKGKKDFKSNQGSCPYIHRGLLIINECVY